MEDAPSPNTLLRYPDDVNDVTLPPKYRDRINNNYDALLSDVDLPGILPKLRQHGVITEEQFEDLWHEKQSRQARKYFLTILPTRGRDAYLWFCHTLLKKAEQKFLFKLLVDEEAVMLIKNLVEADEEERRLNSAAAEDVMLSLMSSPIGSQSNETHSHAFSQRDQTVPKSLEMSFSPAREESTTVQAVQPQDDSLVPQEGGLYQHIQESVTLGPRDPNVTDLKTAAESARGVNPQEEEMGEVVADFSEPNSEHARQKRTNETSGQSDPKPEEENRGSVEGDLAARGDYDEYEITATDPDWVRGLREYQKELAEPGIRGDNYIICATTGSGKTMVAAYVVYHHLRRFGNKARVVLFAPTVALVRQQYGEFRKWFSGQKVDYLVGPETDDKAGAEIMIKFNEITVLTPAIFNIALKSGKIKGLHLVTMMIFDECHHTHGENIYNQIMGRYVDNKVLLKRGNNDIPPRLPQIIGITASLGVGDAKANDSAVQFILRKCANLDARGIAVVKKHQKELAKHVKGPTEDMKTIPGRKDDPFSKTIQGMMTMIEDKILQTPATEKVALADFEFPERKEKQIYLCFLSVIMSGIMKLPPRDYNRRSIISCLEYLAVYHRVLTLHDEARSKDALNLLQRMLELRADSVKEGDPTEMWLNDMYIDRWTFLKEVSEDPAYPNPKLIALKKMIMEAFEEDEETLAILFTKTKESTTALRNWVNEDPDLKCFRAMKLTGSSSEDSAGMSSRAQQDVLQCFNLGKSRLLIATSVAEEGLDIKACNCVFRYNYTTNEIGRVQAKGRARREDSKYHTITDEDKQHLEHREKMNLYREGLMRIAVDKINKMDPAYYEELIWHYQKDAFKDRLVKERLRKARLDSKCPDTFLVCCYRCDQIVCKSTDLVCFQETHHTIIDPELDYLIIVKEHRRPQKFGSIQKLSKVYCKECKCDWGLIVNYKDKVNLPIFKSSGFTYFKMLDDGSRGERVSSTSNKKWDDAPCAFREVSEDEIYEKFRGKVYPQKY